MSEEQKSETGGTPPPASAGGTPPPASGGGTPPPAAGAPGPWIPPRLRARLEMADEPPPPSENPLLGYIAMAVIAAMIGGLVYWRIQKSHAEAKEAAEKAAADRRAVVADSLHSLAVLDSLKAVHRADSVAAFAALPAWKKALIVSGADTSQAAATAEETGHFTIDAGSYLFADAAEKAAATLRGATRVPVKVSSDSTAGNFHVYVGNYKVRGEAAFEAKRLFDAGKLEQANVVKLDS